MTRIEQHTAYADDGTGRSWDLDAMVRTDGDGSTHPQAEWSAAELATVMQWRDVVWRQDRVKLIRKEVATLRTRAANADADWTTAAGMLADAQADVTTIANSTPALTLAYVTAIRDKMAAMAQRQVAALQWRQQVDVYVRDLCLDEAWLGALAVDLTDDPPPPA